MSRSSTHTVQAQPPREHEHRFEAITFERFDRIAFTMAVLKVLKPSMTVAVYPRTRRIEVHQSGGGVDRLAMVGIPPHATRENIARTLVELSGRSEQPFLVDLLIRCEVAESAPLGS